MLSRASRARGTTAVRTLASICEDNVRADTHSSAGESETLAERLAAEVERDSEVGSDVHESGMPMFGLSALQLDESASTRMRNRDWQQQWERSQFTSKYRSSVSRMTPAEFFKFAASSASMRTRLHGLVVSKPSEYEWKVAECTDAQRLSLLRIGSDNIGVVTKARATEHSVSPLRYEVPIDSSLSDGSASADEEVELLMKETKIPCGHHLLGKVINPLCEPFYGTKLDADLHMLVPNNKILTTREMKKMTPEELSFGGTVRWRPLLRHSHKGADGKMAPALECRYTKKEQVLTGLRALDVLWPIGRGSSVAVAAPGDASPSEVLRDMAVFMAQQERHTPEEKVQRVVYCAMDCSSAELDQRVRSFQQRLGRHMRNVVIVGAPNDDTRAQQSLAPLTALAIADDFRRIGEDAVVVLDGLHEYLAARVCTHGGRKQAIGPRVPTLIARLLQRAYTMPIAMGGAAMTVIAGANTDVDSDAGTRIRGALFAEPHVGDMLQQAGDSFVKLETPSSLTGFRYPSVEFSHATLCASPRWRSSVSACFLQDAVKVRDELAALSAQLKTGAIGARVEAMNPAYSLKKPDPATHVFSKRRRFHRLRQCFDQRNSKPLSRAQLTLWLMLISDEERLDAMDATKMPEIEAEVFAFVEENYPQVMQELGQLRANSRMTARLRNEAQEAIDAYFQTQTARRREKSQQAMQRQQEAEAMLQDEDEVERLLAEISSE